ncbi:peptidyl-arginine deiminase [Basidiobolus meristosporus CBS 931.73]|uniref:Peptidyl-arginine deiminase n=1 Tax=Basidiobolus meristosporus CBS 931.73 TaxID=1314790 RepID=A0A1Y1XWL7_9FUNG|nr:peptidyl-arginine deiminase [Basidiobolus meristosporus CBS 931.73]|eukprot:ORX90151.1 peptidyl-arginine deiminase [Basidiobolus meristosporus CBS 931.73]
MCKNKPLTKAPTGYRIAPEWEPHKRTIMAWPASTYIWRNLLTGAQRNIAQLAQAISRFEPVQVLVSPDQIHHAKKALGDKVEVIPIAVDDFWTRDTTPLFLTKGKETVGVDYNFNGWGMKVPSRYRKNDGSASRNYLSHYKIPRLRSILVAEGGAIETDGQGTLLVTESSIVNSNRNPGMGRKEIETELKSELGIQKVIWLKGVKGKDITDSHVDTLARFVAPGVVVVSRPGPARKNDPDSAIWAEQYRQAMQVLTQATDAKGNRLKIIQLPEPDYEKIRGMPAEGATDEVSLEVFGDSFLGSYANFYIANGAIIMPEFGDAEADRAAQNVLRGVFPGRQIVPLNIDYIASQVDPSSGYYKHSL